MKSLFETFISVLFTYSVIKTLMAVDDSSNLLKPLAERNGGVFKKYKAKRIVRILNILLWGFRYLNNDNCKFQLIKIPLSSEWLRTRFVKRRGNTLNVLRAN